MPLTEHRRHDGTCLVHWRLVLVQATQARLHILSAVSSDLEVCSGVWDMVNVEGAKVRADEQVSKEPAAWSETGGP